MTDCNSLPPYCVLYNLLRGGGMNHSSAWQKHKAKACEKDKCIYCEEAPKSAARFIPIAKGSKLYKDENGILRIKVKTK